MKNKLFYSVAIISLLISCADHVSDCVEGERRIKEWHGNIIVDSIFNDWRNHAQAAVDKNGNKVLFMPSNLVMQPEMGDSLYKDTGTVEYTLVRGDSLYIQKWDCIKRKQIIVSRFKKG
jgi:hypothetical protein